MPKHSSAITYHCPTCQGAGLVATQRGEARCPECGGRGTILWLAGHLLAWDRSFDSWRILEHRIERFVRFTVNGVLILLGLAGLLALVKVILDRSAAGEELTTFWRERNGLLTLFSASLLSDLYLATRFIRSFASAQRVIPRSYDAPTVPPEAIDWESLRRDPKLAADVAAAFSESSGKLLESAWRLAGRLGHARVEPLHVLASSLAEQAVQIVLARLSVSGETLKERISGALGRLAAGGGSPPLSAASRRAILSAYGSAYDRRGRLVEPEDLLVGLASFENPAQTILFDLGVELPKLKNVVTWMDLQRQWSKRLRAWRSQAARKPKGVMNRAMTAVATPLLDRVSRDLTQLARAGVLIPVVDREQELEAVFRLLESGRSVVLVGNPGVGKSAIVEGIAARMAAEDVPEVLQDKRLVSLSVATLVGSAARPGELEERVLAIMNEMNRAGNIVLVVDNIQNLVGLTTEGAQALDVAGLFSQLLSSGVLLAIAMTSPADFRRYVESSSLASVLSSVTVEEVDEQAAILVLESKAPLVEAKHQVFMSYDAIEKTVEHAIRYLHERYLPEKAIDLLEEVAVSVRKRRGKNAIAGGEDVAEIVAEKTRVPVTQITAAESEKLLHLEEQMHKRIVGQDEAVRAVSAALRRARAELRDVRRPIANFLFLGPTGVGKTELAKTVAEVYFGKEDQMIRLDMSEYQDQTSIYRLIGAPAGVGGGGGGFLTEAVRKQPFSLLLLDELEKAHPEILNVFLQVMDDGRLTDAAGRTIDFTNIILIATSNAGTQFIQEAVKASRALQEIKRELVERVLFQYFRPEFLNRFDDIILFKPLSLEEIIAITKLLLAKVAARLGEKGISLRVSEAAVEELARLGFDPIYGARPLRRAVQEHVDNALANFLLTGKLGRRDVAVLESGGVIRVEQAPEV